MNVSIICVGKVKEKYIIEGINEFLKRMQSFAKMKIVELKEDGYVYKKEISYENFNISKSQFYLIYSNLKKENFLSEVDNKIFLNLKKIDPYLEKLGET